MRGPETFLDAVVAELHEAGIYNRNDQVGPAVVLWPDEQRQWEGLIPLLREQLPLLTLGPYHPERRVGPAYWLRCMIGRTLPEDRLPDDEVPILYLPGYGKHDLRAIEECPKPLQPLAELQYRGTLWVHRNGRDWTVTGFLHNLDIPVAADNATKTALSRALTKLAHEPLARLRKLAPLDAVFFNELLHPDAARQILLWLSDPEGFRDQLREAEWNAFRALSRERYGVDPGEEQPVDVARRLADTTGEWAAVWKRYTEAPESYPGILYLMERATPRQLPLLEPSPYWPENNREAEDRLRQSLKDLHNELPLGVRRAIEALETEHGRRREWVWAKIGQAPLAQALRHLSRLAQLTEDPLGGTDVAQIAESYTAWGWEVDAAVLDTLAAVQHQQDVGAVKGVLSSLYRKWLQEAAVRMQQAVVQNPLENYRPEPPPTGEPGTCILFSDALRYDIGQRLAENLEGRGMRCDIAWRLSALPTITAVGKPAVSPVAEQVEGRGDQGLTPVVTKTGTSVTAGSLRRLLQDAGWQTLSAGELGDPSGRAWTEIGDLDSYGHHHDWKIAHRMRDEVKAIGDRVESLLDHGWKRVEIVTDHGWLMLPGDLPKVELPIHVTEVRKGRCAVLKPGVKTDQPSVPWHWNPEVRIAVAPGIHCYEAGKEYEHGGISPQECVIPVITATAGE